MGMAVTYQNCVHEKLGADYIQKLPATICAIYSIICYLKSQGLRHTVTYFCLWFSMISHTKEKPLLEGIWAKKGRSSWRMEKTA
jgi:hypothetical protein